ncbi:hypothetical protein V8E55_011876, partial [Tylopilus felleus]
DDLDELKAALHPDDLANFLKLCMALHILIKNMLLDCDIIEADHLLREYCTELIQLYGSSCIKPNHHYATHIATFVRNFGPLHDFWTFLYEWLNKVLKSFKTDNHSGGKLETTFLAEFHRMSQSSHLTYSLLQHGADSFPAEVMEIMFKSSCEERGTVAGLAALSKNLDEEHVDGNKEYTLSPRCERKWMSIDTNLLLAKTLNFSSPQTPVYCQFNRPTVSGSIPISK